MRISLKIMLINLGMVFTMSLLGCSNFKEGEQSTRFGPSLIVTVGQNPVKWYPEDKENNYTTIPQMIIEATTPVVCSNTPDGKFDSSQCALSQKIPLPEKIVFRYGKWLSENEEYEQFPPIPREEYANLPRLVDDYKSRAAFEKAKNDFYEQLFNVPKYKAMREAKRASKEAIDWHTYTIYPQEIMQKLDKERSTHPMSTSEVTVILTFYDDFSVTVSNNLRYLDAIHP